MVISFPEAVRISLEILLLVGRKSAEANRPKSTWSTDPFSRFDGRELLWRGDLTILEVDHTVLTLVAE
jgi:hypothetical protein